MRSLKQYIAESVKTYNYTIKIAGEVDKNFVDLFKYNLNKFEPVKLSDAKSTPIQKDPYGFPNLQNQPITIIKAEFRYPATEPMIQQIAQLLGFDPNRVLMQTPNYTDNNQEERDKIEDQNKDLLDDPTYPAPDAKQKALSKDYATGPYDHAVLKNAYRSDFTIAGEKTKPAETTNDLPQGDVSPMSTVKRPPKPATGRNPRG